MVHNFYNDLESLKKSGRYRTLKTVNSEQASEIILNGRRVLLFCSNNYLGLASRQELKKTAIEAIEKYGTGSGASRLVSGNMKIHEELEEHIARFKGTETALLFNSGYHANLGVIPALAGRGDLILSDELNHASIIDGCRLSRADVVTYPHCDFNFVEDVLRRSTHNKKLIVTDGVFSMDGDIAPLKELVELKEHYGALLMVDEAHATGVTGRNGRGVIDRFMLTGRVDVTMGTLGKALGGYGAYIATSKVLREYLINTARSFIFSTSLPPSVCASAIKAIELIESEPELILRLHRNVRMLKEHLKNFYQPINDNEIPIIPLIIGDSETTMMICEELLDENIFIQGIRPPSVPEGTSRLRLTVTATHTPEQIQLAVEAIERVFKRHKLLLQKKSPGLSAKGAV